MEGTAQGALATASRGNLKTVHAVCCQVRQGNESIFHMIEAEEL